MGLDPMMLVFWMLSFKPAFPLFSLTFIKRLFSSSSLSTIKVVSSACLRLLIFLLVILIPARDSSSPAFHMMYSSYMLNKQSDNIQSWITSFPVLNQSVVPCSVLTVASWPAYIFLRSQVDLSAIWDSFDSNQFMLCPWAISFFQKLCPAPFPPVSIVPMKPLFIKQWLTLTLPSFFPSFLFSLPFHFFLVDISESIYSFTVVTNAG